MREKGKNSIKKLIARKVCGMVIALSFVLGVIGIVLVYRSSVTVLRESMTETAKVAGTRIEAEMQKFINAAIALGTSEELAGIGTSRARKKEIIDQSVLLYGLEKVTVTDEKGMGVHDEADYSGENWFQMCMKGEPYVILDPASDQDGNYTVSIATPLWKGGRKDTMTAGAVKINLSHDYLSSIISEIHIAQSGGAYMLDQNGTLIADTSPERVGNINMQKQAETDASARRQAAIERKMTAGEMGYGVLTSYQGQTQIVAYAPVPGMNGWSVGIYVNQRDFLDSVYQSVLIDVIVLAAAMILFGGAAVRLGSSIAKPIIGCAGRLQILAEGDLQTEVEAVPRKDEIGILAAATGRIVEDLKRIVQDEVELLTQMAAGDFTVRSRAEYKGGFAPLQQAIGQILDSLNGMMRQINSVAGQVSESAAKAAGNAKAINEGSAEQTEAIEELSVSIEDISGKIRDTAENTSRAKREADQVEEQILDSNGKMKEMVSAMQQIGDSSEKIKAIIKTIQEIASQTGMLALNASIEAARAGEAGKGFAVVAGEVEQLSVKTTEAAKQTAELIESTAGVIGQGVDMAGMAAGKMKEVVESIGVMVNTLEEIEKASAVQADALANVTAGVNQIADVVKQNSRTAQESAGDSEELAAQARKMYGIVENIKYIG